MTSQPLPEAAYLSGKVRCIKLPTYETPPGPEAPPLKRLLLPQGELAQLYNNPAGICYLAYIELRVGTTRGNHFHKIREEYVYLLSGEIVLSVQGVSSKERVDIPMTVGDMAIISPEVAHALRVVRAGQAIEFARAQFDPNDTYRYPMA